VARPRGAKARAAVVVERLAELHPDASCALKHTNAYELLSATILSAQCTDERVNKVTPALFARLHTAEDYASVAPHELEKLIHSTGFYRNKAKNIRGMGKMLVEKYDGIVPQTMEQLLELPGVARKTANVVLGTAFGKTEGVVVDTHVARNSKRLGLTRHEVPHKIEKDLMAQVPKTDWIWFSHALIHHGRRICRAISPKCPECPIQKNCPNPPVKF
jgi:endonuclease-3